MLLLHLLLLLPADVLFGHFVQLHAQSSLQLAFLTAQVLQFFVLLLILLSNFSVHPGSLCVDLIEAMSLVHRYQRLS